MKALFFHAAAHAAHPRVVGALHGQVRATLRPFRRFVGQAIHTAKQRQTRYELSWEPVRDLVTVRLEPLDTVLRVPRTEPLAVLRSWPDGAAPDPSQPGFVVNRGIPIQVLRHQPNERGLSVHTEPAIEAGDQVVWCGVTCLVERGADPAPPTRVEDLDGEALEVIGAPEPDGDGWLLRLRGRLDDRDLRVDGAELEALAQPDHGPRRVVDAQGRTLAPTGLQLRLESPPAPGELVADDGRRYRWRQVGRAGRTGNWVQLLPPAHSGADEHMDPRAAFCEGDVREVWTQARHHPSAVIRVHSVDAERYQLKLERMPRGRSLFLPVDLRNLHLQRRALRQLAECPSPHHGPLLRLCEDPRHARWPAITPVPIAEHEWMALTDPSRSGTDEQRRFVQAALAAPDVAILEGPPGSGKTTAICELVQQLVLRGQRVLLCASTHVAIDNVLERLVASSAPIDAVRVGNGKKVDATVADHRLDARVDALVAAWRSLPSYADIGDPELRAMATRTVVMAANLTCGTTMGIVNHPLFRDRDTDLHIAERPIATIPHWDVLIIDEASKTLVPEFLVPALMARRCVIVGDVRQLPPFSDRAHLVANLRSLVDAGEHELFPHDHQRACLLAHRLLRPDVRQPAMRWLVVEPPGVLDHLVRELATRDLRDVSWVRLVPDATGDDELSPADLAAGGLETLRLATADLVLVADDLLAAVSDRLPANLLLARDLAALPPGTAGRLEETAALSFRRAYWQGGVRRVQDPYRDPRARNRQVASMADAEQAEADWLQRHDVASEIAWRVTRSHELRRSRGRERRRIRQQLTRLLPRTVDISGPLGEIEDIGLPSVLEVLQEGIGVERADRRSALTMGLRASPSAFSARFQSLTFQHRMHPEIASLPRDVIYDGTALRDANTIAARDQEARWTFGAFPSRRAWLDVRGRESRGVNADEVDAVEQVVRRFLAWAQERGPAPRPGGRWEVACLAFYVKQEQALSAMLQRVTGDGRSTRFLARDAPVEIRCATVDRFQGREADLVLLSLRNTRRTGFLDSPNRLNVGITRARQQLVVVGNAPYFARCGTAEPEALARRTRVLPSLPRSRR